MGDEPAPRLDRALRVRVYPPLVLSKLGQGMLIPVLPLYLTAEGFGVGTISMIVPRQRASALRSAGCRRRA